MRLTKQTNYAVRMLMYCAANEGKLSRIPEIARAYGVSELFLFKILQPLNKAGLVETVRGRNGGVRLGKPAEKISLFDVVKVTEDSFAMAECFEDGAVECPLVDSLRPQLGASQGAQCLLRCAGGIFHRRSRQGAAADQLPARHRHGNAEDRRLAGRLIIPLPKRQLR